MQITVRKGPAAPRQEPAAKRLQLTAERFAVLAGAAPAALPPLFADAAAATDVADTLAVWSDLAALGVAERDVVGEFAPVPAVATTLRLLTGAPFAVQLLAGTGDGGVAGWWSLDGRRGAGLRLLPGGAVEVSAFLARHWQDEVTRAVPTAEVFTVGSGSGSVVAGLSALDPAATRPVGESAHRLAFDDLAALLEAPDARPTSHPVDPQLAAAIAHPAARLQATVFARLEDSTASGSVTWVAAPGGWPAIRPDRSSGRDGQLRMVDVVPVQPADLAAELAPLLLAGATRFANSSSVSEAAPAGGNAREDGPKNPHADHDDEPGAPGQVQP